MPEFETLDFHVERLCANGASQERINTFVEDWLIMEDIEEVYEG